MPRFDPCRQKAVCACAQPISAEAGSMCFLFADMAEFMDAGENMEQQQQQQLGDFKKHLRRLVRSIMHLLTYLPEEMLPNFHFCTISFFFVGIQHRQYWPRRLRECGCYGLER